MLQRLGKDTQPQAGGAGRVGLPCPALRKAAGAGPGPGPGPTLLLSTAAAVLYCYFYKRTAMRLGDPRFYCDSLWLRKEFLQGSR